VLKVLIAEDDLMIADLAEEILVGGDTKFAASPARYLRPSPWLSFTSPILSYSTSASPTVVSAPRSPPSCFRLAGSASLCCRERIAGGADNRRSSSNSETATRPIAGDYLTTPAARTGLAFRFTLRWSILL
jgi:hypothetical protein